MVFNSEPHRWSACLVSCLKKRANSSNPWKLFCLTWKRPLIPSPQLSTGECWRRFVAATLCPASVGVCGIKWRALSSMVPLFHCESRLPTGSSTVVCLHIHSALHLAAFLLCLNASHPHLGANIRWMKAFLTCSIWRPDQRHLMVALSQSPTLLTTRSLGWKLMRPGVDVGKTKILAQSSLAHPHQLFEVSIFGNSVEKVPTRWFCCIGFCDK